MPPLQWPDKFLLWFAPEYWPEVDKFQKFMGAPYEITRELRKGVRTVSSHLQKFNLLVGIANQFQEHLIEDYNELERNNYTQMTRHKEFAALSETLICELYSCLDGVRRTLYAIYGHGRVEGVQNQSTNALFARASDNRYGSGFPETIRVQLASAYTTWFPELRNLRTQVVHSDVGFCSTDPDTGVISYKRDPFEPGEPVFLIEDIVEKINELSITVIQLTNDVFGYLYSQLELVDHRVVCGQYMGRLYERAVAPEKALSFDSGTCLSKTWFENEPGLECPMRYKCGAYARSGIRS